MKKPQQEYDTRLAIAGVFFVVVGAFLLVSLGRIPQVLTPGISDLYNQLGPQIAPNMITVILFDFRGYDTLGEALVLVSGVVAVALVFGRGSILGRKSSASATQPDNPPTVIQDIMSPAILFLLIPVGIYLTLGGHITPGGGFQGGSVIAAAVLFSLAIFGRNQPIRFNHDFLVSLETTGALLYILLGIAGLCFSGFFLYNIGTDLYEIIPPTLQYVFKYPDITSAGIIPYLNVAILLKVSAGLTTILFVLLEVKE